MSDDSNLLAFGFKYRSLFDVKLEECFHLALPDRLVAFPTDSLEFVSEPLSLGVRSIISPILIMHAYRKYTGSPRVGDTSL